MATTPDIRKGVHMWMMLGSRYLQCIPNEVTLGRLIEYHVEDWTAGDIRDVGLLVNSIEVDKKEKQQILLKNYALQCFCFALDLFTAHN